MTSNYEKLLRKNLHSLYNNRPENLDTRLPAVQKDNLFHFRAFGEDCCLGPEGINLSGKPAKGTEGLLISLYAIHVGPDPVHIEPLKAFRDLPGSMPYQNAFTVNSERVLIPYVSRIREVQGFILDLFNGQLPPEGVTGDFSFVIYPLPKIALTMPGRNAANGLSFTSPMKSFPHPAPAFFLQMPLPLCRLTGSPMWSNTPPEGSYN